MMIFNVYFSKSLNTPSVLKRGPPWAHIYVVLCVLASALPLIERKHWHFNIQHIFPSSFRSAPFRGGSLHYTLIKRQAMDWLRYIFPSWPWFVWRTPSRTATLRAKAVLSAERERFRQAPVIRQEKRNQIYFQSGMQQWTNCTWVNSFAKTISRG